MTRGLAPFRVPIALLCCIAIVSACAGSGSSDDKQHTAPTSTSVAADVDSFVHELAAAGIGVYDGPSAPRPEIAVPGGEVSGMFRFQAELMARQAADHFGMTGAQFDTIASGVPGNIRPSALLSVWLSDSPSAGAAIARRVVAPIGTSKPVDLVIPSAMLAIFAADVARHFPLASSTATTSPNAPTSPVAGHAALRPGSLPANFELISARRAGVIGDACQLANNFKVWIDEIVTKIRELPPPKAELGFAPLDWIANRLIALGVDALKDVAIGAIKSLAAIANEFAQKILSFVADAATVAAIAAHVYTFIVPWSAAMTETPDHNSKGVVGGKEYTGEFVVTISKDGRDEWPADVLQCADAVKVTLPPLRPIGNKVTWSVQQGADLIAPIGGSGSPTDPLRSAGPMHYLDEHSQSHLAYTTALEDKKLLRGDETQSDLAVTATVNRDNLDPLRKLVSETMTKLLAGLLPSFLATPLDRILNPQVQKLLKPAFDTLEHIRDASVRSRPVPVKYHTERDAYAIVVFNKHRREIGLDNPPEFAAYTCDGLEGHWHGSFMPALAGGAPVDFTFKDEKAAFTRWGSTQPYYDADRKKVEGTIQYGVDASLVLNPDPEKATMTISGTFHTINVIYALGKTADDTPGGLEHVWDIAAPLPLYHETLNQVITRLEPGPGKWAHPMRSLAAVQCAG